MALVTQLLVRIQGNADGIISALAKTGKGSRDAAKDISAGFKAEFEKARKEADRLYKDVARLEKEAATHAKAGRTELSGALLGQAGARKIEADAAAAAVIAAEKRIAAEAIKTGQITKTALAGGVSGMGASFAREGGVISRAMGTIRAEATKTGTAIKTGISSGAFEGIGKSATVAGAGILAGFAVATKATLTFDKQLSSTRAVLDGSAADMTALRQAALDAGAATVFSATDAARAETELAKAGIALKDILGGGLRGALDLAAAGQLDLGEAATIAAQAMTTFGLSGGDVGHVADVLASAANSSTASVQSLAEGLSESGGVAKQFGFSLEDTVATLALFDQNAIRGAEGGNALKTMLLRLGAPTASAAAAMKELGIATYDSSGAVRPASELFQQLRDRLSGLSDQRRNAALQTIFGTRAIRGAAIAVKEGAQGFDKFRSEVDKTGTASKFATVQMDNLSGDIERLKGSIETGLIGAGSGATSVLRGFAQVAESAADSFAGLPGPIQGAAGGLVLMSGAALTASGAVAVLGPRVALLKAQLEGVGLGGGIAAQGLGALGKLAGAAGVIFALGSAMEFLESRVTELVHGKVNFPELAASVSSFARTGQVSGEFAKQFGNDLDGLGGKMKDIADNRHLLKGPLMDLDPKHRAAIKDAKNDLKGLDESIASFATSGHADAAAKVFGRVLDEAAGKGFNRAEVLKFFPEYAKALNSATTAANLNADATGKTGTAAGKASGPTSTLAADQEALEEAASAAAAALTKELDALSGFTDLNLGASNSAIAFVASLDDLKKSLTEGGKSFDINSEAGRKNQSALNDAIGAAQAHAQAVGESTAATQGNAAGVAAANLTLQGHRTALIEAAVATGIERGEATLLVDKLLQIKSPPPVVVTANTADATAKVDSFSAAVDRARQRAREPIRVGIVATTLDPFDVRPGRALGGPVTQGKRYETGERGAELFVPALDKPLAVSAAAHLATRAEEEARDGLVRLGIPGGIEPKQARVGTEALLLGKHGPQTFVAPTDGVVVKAQDTKRLMRTEDEDIITRILKRAGADRRTLEALQQGPEIPGRATGGPVQQGRRYSVAERGAEAFLPKFDFKKKGTTPSLQPGIKRSPDGSYNITVGDTNLIVEAGTSGSAKGVNKNDVDRIVERKQAELVAELVAAMRG